MEIKITFLCLLIIIVAIVRINGRLFVGRCRERPSPVVSHFNKDKYFGRWYEIEWYDDEYPTFDECLLFLYTKEDCSLPENYFNSKLTLRDSRNFSDIQTYFNVGEVVADGKLAFTSVTVPQVAPTRVNHQILATDYYSYAFVWDCYNVNSTHYNERMWNFNRHPNPDPRRPPAVAKLINKYFDEQYIRLTYHGEKCSYECH